MLTLLPGTVVVVSAYLYPVGEEAMVRTKVIVLMLQCLLIEDHGACKRNISNKKRLHAKILRNFCTFNQRACSRATIVANMFNSNSWKLPSVDM